MRAFNFVIVLVFAAAFFAACSSNGGANTAVNNASTPADIRGSQPEEAQPSATPSRQLTEADIAKLKWLEGSWRGMNGDQPFFERIRFEGSTMIVETLDDGTMKSVQNTSRFELKDGEFGNTVGDGRSAASEITDNAVQFVPAPVKMSDGTLAPVAKGNKFRFEKQPDGTWNAVLATPALKDKPAGEKVYKMEPWKASSAK